MRRLRGPALLIALALGGCPKPPALEEHRPARLPDGVHAAGVPVLALLPAGRPEDPLAIIRGTHTWVLLDSRGWTKGLVVVGDDAVVDRIDGATLPAGISLDGQVACAALDPRAHPNRVGAYDRRTREWRWTAELPGTVYTIVVGSGTCLVRHTGADGVYRERQLDLADGSDRTPAGGHTFMDAIVAPQESITPSPDGRSLLRHAFVTRLWNLADGQRSRFEVLGADDLISEGWFYADCAWYDDTGALRTDECPRAPRPPDGEAVGLVDAAAYVSGGGATLRLRDASSHRIVAELASDTSLDLDRKVVHDAGVIAAVVGDEVFGWNLRDPRGPRRFAAGKGAVGPFVSQDGRTIAVVRPDGALRSWDLATGAASDTPLPDGANATQWSVGLGPDGALAVVGGAPHAKHRKLYARASAAAELVELPWDKGAIAAWFRWTTIDGVAYLVVVEQKTGVHVFDLAAGKRVGHVRHKQLMMIGHALLALSPDGRRAAFVSDAYRTPGVYVVDLPGAKARKQPITIDPVIVQALAWPDDHTLVASSTEKVERVDVDKRAVSAGPPAIGDAFGLGTARAGVVRAIADGDGVAVVRAADDTVAFHLAFVPGGWFSILPDGRYACGDDGCAPFRCLVEGVLQAGDDPACAAWRLGDHVFADELGR
jgi:hypothetical protein